MLPHKQSDCVREEQWMKGNETKFIIGHLLECALTNDMAHKSIKWTSIERNLRPVCEWRKKHLIN
ncbi:hypothetical protein BLOT_007354 [Blomia tropicalis]|nr:hypothetical protein BLOT_007354 [Blomia tropicalis]